MVVLEILMTFYIGCVGHKIHHSSSYAKEIITEFVCSISFLATIHDTDYVSQIDGWSIMVVIKSLTSLMN